MPRKTLKLLIDDLRRTYKRLRHRRGHGVHSPFVYRLVREVFMEKNTEVLSSEIESRLGSYTLSYRSKKELCSLFQALNYSSTDILFVQNAAAIGEQEQQEIMARAKENGTALVIFDKRAFGKWIRRHHSTSIDRGGYLILFNNHLPKQEFVL